MASPPSPSPFHSPSPSPSPTASPVSSSAAAAKTKKLHPIPWTHQETVLLIQAYQDKWYELRRGQLKASQWEEVAVTVATRCGYDYTEPSKTSTQCRHKMEKLRQRHRAVKKRLGLSFASGWPYFDLMERLEQGPMPISARRPLPPPPPPYHDDDDVDGDDDEEEEEEEEENYRKLQSLEYILRRPAIVNRFSGAKKDGYFRDSPAASKRPREGGYDDGDVVDGQRGGGTERVAELAAEIRTFAKRLVGVENMRMEIMRETERCRLEMENKRIDMILQSQRKIVDSIDKAFGL